MKTIIVRNMRNIILMILLGLINALPNIVLFVGDDIGWADHNLHYDTDITTNTMKKYADEGIMITNHYTSPVCSPTRTSLMTGLYPFRVGMQHQETLCPGTTAHVPLDVPMLPEILKPLGYHTSIIGKWHLGYACEKYTPIGRGFGSHYGYYQGQIDYLTKKILSGYDFWRDGKVEYIDRRNHSTDLYALEIEKQISELPEPFFLYLPIQSVHVPLLPSRTWGECEEIKNQWRKIYCNLIQDVDFLFKVTTVSLKNNQKYGNTFIIFTTDNGGMVDFSRDVDDDPNWPSSMGKNFPLRGSKSTLFEGGVKVTTFFTGGVIPVNHRGSVFSGLSHAVDLAVTIIELAGGELMDMDGIGLWTQILNGVNIRNDVPINIIYSGRSYSAIRHGKYKLITRDAVIWEETDGWWGDVYEKPPPFNQTHYLFDIESDPYERYPMDIESNYSIYAKILLRLFSYTYDRYSEPQFNFPSVDSFPWSHMGVWAPFIECN